MSKHLLRIEDLTKEEILGILARADELSRGSLPKQFSQVLVGLLFFQPSTRTRFGFHAATARIGGFGITLDQPKFQSGMTTPESFGDTLSSIHGYCDIFIIRHPSDDGSSRAAALLDSAVINAGNGSDEHPTQALIDLFAISRHWRRLEGLRIGIAGDLTHSRAAHSLLKALKHFPPAHLRLMCPPGAGPPAHYIPNLECGSITITNLFAARDLDVLYMAGLPAKAPNKTFHSAVRRQFQLRTSHLIESEPPLILCPLPRIDEIEPEVDTHPLAQYFIQSAAAIHVRVAVLEFVLT